MPGDAPALVTVDIGGTLGTTDRPGITATLIAASPLSTRRAVAVLRSRLHTAPTIDEQLVEEVCQALHIPTTAFPRHNSGAPLRLFSTTSAALQQISTCLPVVTLSNVSCVEADLDGLAQLLSPWVTGHFPSCRTGYAKPDRRAFETVAARWRIGTDQIVHIGDSWECDVLGATGSGARAIWISSGRATPVANRLVRPNVLVAADLVAAAGHVRDLCTRRRR